MKNYVGIVVEKMNDGVKFQLFEGNLDSVGNNTFTAFEDSKAEYCNAIHLEKNLLGIIKMCLWILREKAICKKVANA